MAPFDAFLLPDLAPGHPMETFTAGGLTCRFPTPTPVLLERTIARLREARAGLVRRRVDDIIDAVDAAAARLADPSDPIRQEADEHVTRVTGYSPEMTALVLDRMTADWRGDALRGLVKTELGQPEVLDRFIVAGPHRRVRAYGADLAFHVFAGNVPGVAVTSMVRTLLAKAPILAKLASGEPVLPVLFGQALAAVAPDLARCLAVTYWPGGTAPAEEVALREADLVVVYGGEAAAASVRGRARPDQRLVVHGPRFSAGIVTAPALEGDLAPLAADVARAVACFDQHGCVSPHAVWVEDPRDERGDRFADALADALAAAERELPRGRIDAGEASRIHQERGVAEMRGYAGRPVRVLAGEGTSWTVVVDREPTFRPSCLNRFIHVHVVPDLHEAVRSLARHGAYLQSVAVAGPPAVRHQLADALARIGATRVTTFARMPWPPPVWHHDGNGPLLELLRWVDLED
jgi:hypothetical protein